MPHLPATDANSDDYHPMEGPRMPPAPDPDPLPPTVQIGDFRTLQCSLCEEALSRHDNSLHGDQCCGVILETQDVIPQEVRNFDFPYSSTERLGRRQGVTRRTFGSSINNKVIISKQYNRSDFQRTEVELAITSGLGTIVEVIGVIWNQHKVQVLQKLFNGVTLTELLKIRHRLDHDEVYLLTYKMLCFLKDLHSRNILHRNIDPDHIMISRTDQRICVVGCSALCNIDDCTSEFSDSLLLTRGYTQAKIMDTRVMSSA
ncbi:mitogen-activated protein kinase 1-like [Haliotis rubra]|uniref:mitogen-activated protein kinase 1-like n=1 Tax=Haliotis rubra TaxID=36100 RepID=UPI001EE50E7F|nr:mitogen-activated protein kinase 1-like [Haliotis rubra]XP_046567412.1 mitogen-activated protein kinase 1-like [Haliotis rubra]